ncbi:hypothetical protein RB595_009736 [Gaeumannomyces hyphopodioides]
MVHWRSALGTALVATSASASPVARRGEVPPAVPPVGEHVIVPGAYIAELADEDTGRFLDHVENRAGLGNVTERFRFGSRAFRGVSFRLDNPDGPEESTQAKFRRISELPQVKNLWPVTVVPMPKPVVHWTAAGTPLADVHRRAAAAVGGSYAPHVQTQVDRLLAEGFTGKGLRIGIVDTGVDYTHPALGGCFGPGCVVEYGADLVGDSYNGSNKPVPDADPMDTCVGHGTHVAGIIAAKENPLGFRGAAPGAKLGMYRVFGCTGGSSSDVILQATLRAFEDGSDIITGSLGRAAAGWANDPMSLAISRIVDLGVPCTFAVGNRVGGAEGVFGVSAPASGLGVMGITSFENSETPTYDSATGQYSSVPNSVDGGFASVFGLWGSTFELTMKPQFGAPGGSIISTMPVPMGSYGVASGTSMATPLAAGIVALVMEARGTRDSALITRLLSATAKPNVGIDWVSLSPTPGIVPVPWQGAGLLQAYDAVHATALLSVPALELMDKARFSPDVSFTVTNLGNTPVTYNLSHAPALTAATLNPVYRSSTPDLYPYYATLKFQSQSVTIAPNSSVKVHLTISPPTQLAENLLPFYSGWVVLNGTDATGSQASSLSLPYFGTTASMVDMKVLASDRIWLSRSDDPRLSRIADGTTFQLPAPANHSEWAQPVLNGSTTALPAGVMPTTWTWILLGSKEVRIEAVPVATAATTGKDNGLRMLTLGSIAGYPMFYEGPRSWQRNWDGQLADGTQAPAGRYTLVTLALKLNGDADKLADYDRFDSVEFNIRYV